MRHGDSQGYKRTPVMGRSPGLKRLFAARELTRENGETIVLITPRVVEDFDSDWNVEHTDKVREIEEALESDTQQLRDLMDAELAEEDTFLGRLTDSTPVEQPVDSPARAVAGPLPALNPEPPAGGCPSVSAVVK